MQRAARHADGRTQRRVARLGVAGGAHASRGGVRGEGTGERRKSRAGCRRRVRGFDDADGTPVEEGRNGVDGTASGMLATYYNKLHNQHNPGRNNNTNNKPPAKLAEGHSTPTCPPTTVPACTKVSAVWPRYRARALCCVSPYSHSPLSSAPSRPACPAGADWSRHRARALCFVSPYSLSPLFLPPSRPARPASAVWPRHRARSLCCVSPYLLSPSSPLSLLASFTPCASRRRSRASASRSRAPLRCASLAGRPCYRHC
eukprot:225107-Chlamydomonas_euryale.AAC.2